MRLPSSSARERGAARRRFHRPRRRASSTPTPTSMPMKRTNCTPMPAKECAKPLYGRSAPEVVARVWVLVGRAERAPRRAAPGPPMVSPLAFITCWVEEAAHHRQRGRLRRVVVHSDLRASRRRPSAPRGAFAPKPAGSTIAARTLPSRASSTRLGLGELPQVEGRVALSDAATAFEIALPSASTTAIGTRLGFVAARAEDRAEEGGDDDRRGDRHHQRPPVRE